MFNVRHDFGFVGRLFGIPRAWLSKIGAFCSSFSTRGRLINISIPDNPSPNKAPVVFEINEDALRAFVIANAPSSDPTIPTNVLTDDDIGTTVAAFSHSHSDYAALSHSHAISDITNLQSTLSGKADSTHSHSGVYQPIGNYAALTASSKPVAPLTFYATNGAQQEAGVGSATEAARADHIHVLPATVVTEFGDQSIYGVKRFEDNKLIIQAAPQGSRATMSFKSEAGSSLWAGLQASSAQIVVFYVHSSGNTRLNITDDYATVTKNNNSGSVVLFADGSLRLTARSNGASISFRYNAASSDTAAISESASGVITITSVNHARLSDAPIVNPSETGYDALQIATVGVLAPADPGTSVTSLAPTSDAEDNFTWTAGGSNGLAVTKLMRTKYVTSGTTPILYAYYRTFKYDKFGRLYSVTKETREIVANTAVISWA